MKSKRGERGVRFPEAVVVAASGAWPVLLIEVSGQRAWIHRDYFLGDELQGVGDRGTLVLSRWAAEGYGLLRAEPPVLGPSWAVGQRAA
jgi:hypothetical protein